MRLLYDFRSLSRSLRINNKKYVLPANYKNCQVLNWIRSSVLKTLRILHSKKVSDFPVPGQGVTSRLGIFPSPAGMSLHGREREEH
jgi:hypothetical protein